MTDPLLCLFQGVHPRQAQMEYTGMRVRASVGLALLCASLLCSVPRCDMKRMCGICSFSLEPSALYNMGRRKVHEDTMGLWLLSPLSLHPEVQVAHLDLLTHPQLSFNHL